MGTDTWPQGLLGEALSHLGLRCLPAALLQSLRDSSVGSTALSGGGGGGDHTSGC